MRRRPRSAGVMVVTVVEAMRRGANTESARWAAHGVGNVATPVNASRGGTNCFSVSESMGNSGKKG